MITSWQAQGAPRAFHQSRLSEWLYVNADFVADMVVGRRSARFQKSEKVLSESCVLACFGNAFAASRLGGLCDVNLETQISWQARCLVDIEAHISSGAVLCGPE